ncbi:MAG: hypothetical protein ACOYL6_08650 [Bacteriovoracaceae bacterium]
MRMLIVGLFLCSSLVASAEEVCVLSSEVVKYSGPSNTFLEVRADCTEILETKLFSLKLNESQYGKTGGLGQLKAKAIKELVKNNYKVKSDNILMKD